MANEIRTLNQMLKINETGKEIPAVALLITGSFENILKLIFVKAKGEYKTMIDIISDAMYKGSNLIPDEMQFVPETIKSDDNSGRQINAVAVLITEPVKNRLDTIMMISNDKEMNSYEKVITNAVFRGIDLILKKLV